MERYTIYCYKEQAMKALELGAQLDTWGFAREPVIPTTEQMIGWLREKEIFVYVFPIWDDENYHELRFKGEIDTAGACLNYVDDYTYKNAILDAIDLALDYLEEQQKINKMKQIEKII